ncbi:B-cell receptor CD22 [Notolabrus celidotus]|uniref:B-cell receptor CD22 n=1 Tax=Notolabrus celidotus TaxID=1203425 RepID=UPI00148F5436|nr:B-cell receptor CD22 [Notolabrus celidotus]
MTAQTVVLLVCLVLIKEFSCVQTPTFNLQEGPLTAVEGSCAEIKCFKSSSVTQSVKDDSAYWFWIKDATYKESKYVGTIIYSSNQSIHPLSDNLYADKVTYTGSSDWGSNSGKPTCSVLICNLNKSDSGDYSFRYIGRDHKWITKINVTLTVTENPCPITFERPSVVNENSTISLKCSAPSSCTLNLQIKSSTQLISTQSDDGKQKSISASYQVSWKDDGREVSCQTVNNTDVYLIQNISLAVQYAPRDVLAKMTPTGGQMVKENQSVTLNCSAKGNPMPTFTWFKNGKSHQGAAEWKFASIKASDSGEYFCEAVNTFDKSRSDKVSIDVKYPPEVEVKASPAHEVTERDKITLTCHVKRSNPRHSAYSWYRNNSLTTQKKNTFVIESIGPQDRGSYTCNATNSAGTGTSGQHQIIVQYRPRSTNTSILEHTTRVKVGESLTFTCNTDAYPRPSDSTGYSWYRYKRIKQVDSSQWKSRSSYGSSLRLERVQRTDEACYICNATNSIGTGDNSMPKCIEVLYPPTTPALSMENKVKEGQLTTISCTVESFPPSNLTLTIKSESNPKSSEVVFIAQRNTLHHTFNATSAHYGIYTCQAQNDIGSSKSMEKELVVKYCPKDVTVKAKPDVVVNENTLLTLHCSANSYPPANSFTWTRMKDGKTESIKNTQDVSVKSVKPSDSGLYSCTASNEMGTGKSQPADIKVRYAPKLTKITSGAEQQCPNGRSSVTLSCTSHSYPKVTQFSWYRKMQEEERAVKVSEHQTLTVYSDQPGAYHCVAKNEINQKSSEPIQLFVKKWGFLRILIILFLLIIFLIVCFFVYRHKRNKYIQRGNSNAAPCFGSLGWWNGTRRSNPMSRPVMAEPFRSRDDLLSDQPCSSNGQRRQQPRPDSIPASDINAVYYTVQLPARQQGPSGEMPIKQKAQHTEDDSLNYASLHFGKKEKNKQAKADVDDVYAMVSKKKKPKKTEQEKQEDYENLRTAHPAKSLNPLNYGSDTSEDEEELNYSKVSFKAKPGHQRASRDSSSSTEETQYSEVKI